MHYMYTEMHILCFISHFLCTVYYKIIYQYYFLVTTCFLQYNDCVVICHIAARARILRVFCMLLSSHVTVHSHGVKYRTVSIPFEGFPFLCANPKIVSIYSIYIIPEI